MPYITESSQDALRHLLVARWSSGYPTFYGLQPVTSERSRWQYGFRSGPDVPFYPPQDSHWKAADTLSILDGLAAEYSTRGPRGFAVHDRDYREYRHKAVSTRSQASLSGIPGVVLPANIVCEGTLQLIDAPVCPEPPSSSAMESMAAKMVRSSAPSQSEINLARSLGELRDFPTLFRAAAVPTSLRSSAQGYLAAVFGFMPTASDLARTAETVIKSQSIIRDYVNHERRVWRRKRQQVLFEDTQTGVVPISGQPYRAYAPSLTSIGPLKVAVSNLMWWTPRSSSDIHTLYSNWSYTSRQTLSTFSTFEMFLIQPEGFVKKRLPSYVSKAENLVGQKMPSKSLWSKSERLLGGGLDVSTVYDLTPWTWLVDWFVDVGGLLRYQNHIANNQIVMSSCGYSFYEQTSATVTLTGWVHDLSRAPSSHVDCLTCSGPFASATLSRTKHSRRRGSPYSVSPTWDFSPQQWAILTALGLARGRGVAL